METRKSVLVDINEIVANYLPMSKKKALLVNMLQKRHQEAVALMMD